MKVNETLNSQAVLGVDDKARSAAARLEQSFIEEMLKLAMPKPSQNGFGGGIGEEQFSSFLIAEQARIISSRIDLGLGRAVEARL